MSLVRRSALAFAAALTIGLPAMAAAQGSAVDAGLAAKGKTKVVTWDTLEAECQDLVDGVVQGLIGQKYFGWGYDALGIIYDIVKHGKTYPAFVDSGFDLVTTPEQAQEFLAKWKSQNFKTGPSPYGNG